MVVIIDATNIIPGKGGCGGGIWVYTTNLLNELDKIVNGYDLKIICLKNVRNISIGLKNIKVLSFNVNNQNFINRMFWLHVRLPLICKFHNADVVHRVIPEVPIFSKAKVVCTLHDLIFDYYVSQSEINRNLSITQKLKFTFLQFNAFCSLFLSDNVIVPSKAVFDQISSRYFNRTGLLHVIHEASDNLLSAVQVVDKSNKCGNGDIFRIVVVAAFFKHKGHKFVIELARQLVSMGVINFKITFRGNPGDERWSAALHRIITEADLKEYFCLSGFSEKMKIEEIYKDYDCLLLLSEYEGFGIPVLEAQRIGIPVVCSDLQVFKEILEDSAFFISTKKSEQLGEKFLDFMNSKEMRERLVYKGFENVKRFSWQKMAEQTLHVYYGRSFKISNEFPS